MSEEKPDTRFRACRMGCGQTEWGAVARVCDQCRQHIAEVARRRKAAKRPGTTRRLSAAEQRGEALVRHLSAMRRGV